ncbi:MAG TPA: MraY family glycosyltransferase [Rhodothermales bacterium]|nr:MraY family glycosyltransferase [Rhodothermales bacterium]
MLIVVIAAGFLLSALTSYALTPVVARVARRNQWIDTPDASRSIHTQPTPRIGGVAIVGAFLVGLIYFALVPYLLPVELANSIRIPSPLIITGALIMAVVGLYDDIRPMHFLAKLAFQFGVAILMISGGLVIPEVFNPFSDLPFVLPRWFAIALTVAWIVGAINAINLLDGMDGLASGVCVIVFGSLTAAYMVMGDWTNSAWVAIIVGALFGFLRYNFNPAQIFMGDSGSMFLGFLVAAYSLHGASRANSLLALLIPIIAMGLPVIDTGLAVIRRFIERKSIFRPDKDHIHHRIVRKLGLSHRNTVLVLYTISIAFGIAAFLLAISDRRLGDNVFTTVVLCGTAVGIFGLLRSLGYLKVPRRRRSAAAPADVASGAGEAGGDVGDRDLATPWDDHRDPLGGARVGQSVDK